jgi:hypothetical protein
VPYANLREIEKHIVIVAGRRPQGIWNVRSTIGPSDNEVGHKDPVGRPAACDNETALKDLPAAHRIWERYVKSATGITI